MILLPCRIFFVVSLDLSKIVSMSYVRLVLSIEQTMLV